MVFLFPPVIMQTVYRESSCDGEAPPRIYRHLLIAMYVLSPLVGVVTIAAIFRLFVVTFDIGPLFGISIGLLFILASIYSTVIMLDRPRGARTPDQQQLQTAMVGLFVAMGGVFTSLLFMREGDLLVAILDRVARSSPIYFLIASVYFENRFVFYDLVVKRALLILVSVLVLGTFFVGTLPWLGQLPGAAPRPRPCDGRAVSCHRHVTHALPGPPRRPLLRRPRPRGRRLHVCGGRHSRHHRH